MSRREGGLNSPLPDLRGLRLGKQAGSLYNDAMFDKIQPIVGPYESRPATCRDYDPRGAEVARLAGAAIYSHFPQVRVEHVGSTSVPGCAGKGDRRLDDRRP